MMSLLFCALCFHRWQALKEWEGHPWGQPGIRMESQIILATLSTIVDNKSSYHLASISSFGRGPWDGYKWSRVSPWHSATAVFVSRSDKITFKIDMIPNPFLKSLLSLFCHSLVLFFSTFFLFFVVIFQCHSACCWEMMGMDSMKTCNSVTFCFMKKLIFWY